MLEYHILNGDALLDQFPANIPGHRIVARECLVDGPVESESSEKFFQDRFEFLKSNYEPSLKWEQYKKDSITEFEKVSEIENNSTINLWFERDLFCQVNLWYISSLLYDKEIKPYIILPTASLQYGFGGMSPQELEGAYQNKTELDNNTLTILTRIWKYYREGNVSAMISEAGALSPIMKFVIEAIDAHQDRVDTEYKYGRPEKTLRYIISQKGNDFGKVFREFTRTESIYGYGDLQVKKIYDYILSSRKY